MKLNRIILPAMACALTLGACEDNKMEWNTPDGHGKVDVSEIPLKLKEKIANYKSIKEYALEYMPGVTIGLGIGADYYMTEPIVKQLADENYMMLTTGNAMKHASVVANNGDLNFTTIDNFFAAIPADMPVYGHNLIWHTQQKQAYLKGLIAPEVEIQSDSNVANVLTGDNTDFNGGTSGGWGSWGEKKDTQEVKPEGQDGSNCVVLANKGDGNFWEAQFAYTFTEPLLKDKLYILKFKAKASSAAGALQFQYQNSTTYQSQGGYADINLTTDWQTYEKEFTITDFEDVDRIILNFGKIGGTYHIDDVEFGLKIEDPMDNIVTNSSFEDGTTTGYTGLWGKYTYAVEAPGQNGDLSLHFTMTDETAQNWDSQVFFTTGMLEVGTTYAYSFYVKSDCNLTVQAIGQNASYQGIYKDQFTAASDWIKCEGEFTYDGNPADIERFGIQFGGTPGSNLWFDNFKFGKKKETAAVRRATTRASSVTYIFKTPEQKRTALLGAMESWIKGMMQHPGMERVKGWDVINEPITDGSNAWRGIDGVFGSNDADGNPDLAPVEDPASGLALNWADDHFYWGHYLGKDYAVKAFEYARQYAPEGTKLYVNDYNLEVSPGKLQALIEMVNYIDANNATGKPIVDGIGTQMHVFAKVTKAEVDAMFQTMAATGKLVRVTELDVRVETKTPSAEQLQQQAETYRMVIESYKENVPAAQQDAITIWSLSDNAVEHEYWFPDDAPNLFDANYERKHAYKGVCDGIAGRDISEDFSGSDWDNAYKE